ncbi:HIT family protein [Metasolibacillus fluoroglycofenilyticus]|uniref:HIT family protein n=1 Tax=Metasolibacillus fluoroglycofenilyticus TaxID=1239396 RepID=UPI003211C562
MNCLGCHLANKKAPVYVIFENEHVCCILDCAPYNEGHVLILPKKMYVISMSLIETWQLQ